MRAFKECASSSFAFYRIFCRWRQITAFYKTHERENCPALVHYATLIDVAIRRKTVLCAFRGARNKELAAARSCKIRP